MKLMESVLQGLLAYLLPMFIFVHCNDLRSFNQPFNENAYGGITVLDNDASYAAVVPQYHY